MSKTNKSPRKVLLVAHAVAKNALPEYASKFSPKKFTQHQLFTCLVLKTFLRTDYRGVVGLLADLPELCKTISLVEVPHFTTLQKTEKRLLCSSGPQLLDITKRDCTANPNTQRHDYLAYYKRFSTEHPDPFKS